VKKDLAYDTKSLLSFGAAGLIISALIISAFQLLPMSVTPNVPVTPDVPVIDPIVETVKGLLIVRVKDAPKELQELNITIDGVRVHRAGNDTEEDPSWIEVTLVETEPFNLLALTDFSIVLAVDELPTGKYTEIRLHVVEANAKIDDEIVPLGIVANGWLKVKVHFTIDEEDITTLILDIDVNEKSIVNSKKLHPVVKTVIEKEKGEKKGWLKPVQTHFRWANDSGGSFEWLADEDEAIMGVAANGSILRLRLAIENDGKINWSDVELKLQYTNDTEGDWTDVNASGSDGVWRYFDGNGTDKALVGNLFLTGSDVMEHFVESSPTETIVMVPVDEQGEWDVCIESNGADPDETYYFRFVLSDGTLLYDYSEYPTLSTTLEVGSIRGVR
jgi:hypothetical protein